METAGPFIERLDAGGAAAHAGAWRDLCSRALEANAFAEPGFLVAAARHIAPPGLEFLLVWEGAERRRLLGVLALAPPRLGVAAVWRSKEAGLAALVLDRDGAAAAFEAAALWLSKARPRAAGLLVPTLAAGGATARLLEAFAGRLGLAFIAHNPRQRAILYAARDRQKRFDAALPGKRLKEWRRLRRRFEERGALAFRSAQGAEAAQAAETFLALEPKNWKGRGGAPLGADPGRAAFARAALAAFAAEGKLRVDSLELNGEPAAMGLILFSKDRAFYWKTAYDEAFAEFSPGVLLTLDLSRRQQDDPRIAATDSCAIAGHPMIERLWPRRLELVDGLVALRRGGAWRLKLWLAERALAGRAKETAKRLIFPLLGRKHS